MLASMLTDYHLHLRPDEDGTTFERYFTAENVQRYLDAAAAAGIEELGVSEHVYRLRQALDLWSHPLWVENAVASVPGVKAVTVNMVFDPPWDQSRMSDEARVALDMW